MQDKLLSRLDDVDYVKAHATTGDENEVENPQSL